MEKVVRTRCSEGRIQAFAQHPLQPKACTDKRKADKRLYVRPCWVIPLIRNARLATLPKGDGSCHSEQRLNEGPEEEPDPSMGPNPITQTPKCRPEIECNERTQRLLIREPERLDSAFP